MLQQYHGGDLLHLQYMNHRMQITQECSTYDLMTNFVKLMQQRAYHCQKVTAVFVTNIYCIPLT